MIVVVGGGFFIAGAAIAELMAFHDARFLEQPHGTVDRGDGNSRIFRHRALVDLFDVRVIVRVR